MAGVPTSLAVWCSGKHLGLSSPRREFDSLYRYQFCGGLAQLGERRTCNAEATGAEPVTSTKSLRVNAF